MLRSKSKKRIGNRKVTKARILYLYVIFGALGALLSFIASFVFDYSGWFSLTPLFLLVGFIIYRFTIKNWGLFWLYISDVEQGKLLMFLNEFTHWDEEHKMKVIKWVYLKKNHFRLETFNRIRAKINEGEEPTEEETLLLKKKVVICPQQIKDGWNEAMLVNALIYAHENIQVLDDELRLIMNLTDDHILAFDLQKESEKCDNANYDKLVKLGKKLTDKKEEE